MPLSTSYTNIINLRADMEFNLPTSDGQFQPLTIRVQGQALTADGGHKNAINTITIGNPTASPLTAKQIYTQLGNVTNLHTQIRNALKQMYLDSIADDISV